jgi:hypothetical protein
MALEAAAHGKQAQQANRDGQQAMRVLLCWDDLSGDRKDGEQNWRRDAMDNTRQGGDGSPFIEKMCASDSAGLNTGHSLP